MRIAAGVSRPSSALTFPKYTPEGSTRPDLSTAFQEG